MASASAASLYTTLEIKKEDKVVDLKAKTVRFDYFESLYSPVVTANMVFLDAGGSVDDKRGQKKVGIKDGLPITGLEEVSVMIETKYGKIDYKKTPFKVSKAPILDQESNRQTVLLSLTGPTEVKNSEVPNFKKYTGRISDNVKKILTEELELSDSEITIDPTRNGYNFLGKGRGVLNIVLDMCKRSIPVSGDPGYFFYQTQDGYNYRSIDGLLAQEPKETYTFSGALKSGSDNDNNDFKIVSAPITTKDQDVLDALKSGTYISRNIFFDPRTFQYQELVFNIGKSGKPKKTLGGEVPFAKDVKSFTKTNRHTLDVGSLDSYVSEGVNNDPREWQAKSVMRYNLLHSQIMNIQVPCNASLRAGDIINVEIESMSEDKELGFADEQQSGKYLILHLCHHFDTNKSYTSMTLVRDTYGKHTSKD